LHVKYLIPDVTCLSSIIETKVGFVTCRRRLSSDARLVAVIDAWLFAVGATKPAAGTLAAYRAGVQGVARRIEGDGPACFGSNT
jgi:hypothetical protein